MTKDTKIIEPQPKLIWPYLAWTFGWTWGWWGLIFLLDNSPFAQIGLVLWPFGPAIGAARVLKISLKTIPKWLFSGKKGTWLWLLIYGGALIGVCALASSGRLMDGVLATLPLTLILAIPFGGGVEEPGWRGFLQPALEKKFPFPLATVVVGIVWAIWHIPLWFYDQPVDRSQDSFLSFLVFCIVLAFWHAALYKRTRSAIACHFLHTLCNASALVFVGIGETVRFGNLSKVHSLFYLGGIALLTIFSIYHWYRTDKEEGRR